MSVTHELKYKMNEFIVNFPETLGLQRFFRLEAGVFCLSPWPLCFKTCRVFLLVVLSLHQPQASLGGSMTWPRFYNSLISELGLESSAAES